MKCPHCKKIDINPHHISALYNAEAYGSNSFVFQCGTCKGKYQVHYIRTVKAQHDMIAKEDKKANLSF